jgi:hypothetical protein
MSMLRVTPCELSPLMRRKRLAFLCGGLEPGRDGVGDYCRQLAASLAARQIDCCLIALNDRTIRDVTHEEIEASGRTIAILRLPECLSRRRRLDIASGHLADWGPDWISLQFVSYAFNRRGIVLRELWWLPRLLRGVDLDVMMHELWIGHRSSDPLIDKLVGLVQRFLILMLLRRLGATAVHTSNAFFAQLLARDRVPATIMPLFGNIPVLARRDDAWFYETLRRAGAPDVQSARHAWWVFGLFGGIARDWPAPLFLSRLADLARRHGRRVLLASIGNTETHVTASFMRWRDAFPSLDFVQLGPRPAEDISLFLNSVDFGLSSYPLYLVGKSGSIATMLEHGLPVIVTWGWLYPQIPFLSSPLKDMVWPDDADLERRLLQPYLRIWHRAQSDLAAASLIDHLHLA